MQETGLYIAIHTYIFYFLIPVLCGFSYSNIQSDSAQITFFLEKACNFREDVDLFVQLASEHWNNRFNI